MRHKSMEACNVQYCIIQQQSETTHSEDHCQLRAVVRVDERNRRPFRWRRRNIFSVFAILIRTEFSVDGNSSNVRKTQMC